MFDLYYVHGSIVAVAFPGSVWAAFRVPAGWDQHAPNAAEIAALHGERLPKDQGEQAFRRFVRAGWTYAEQSYTL